MKAYFKHIQFDFKTPGGTSRGILHQKESWFLVLTDESTGLYGIGECSLLPGLSPDSKEDMESRISLLCAKVSNGMRPEPGFFEGWPALNFAFEMAQLDLANGGKRHLYQNEFLDGHPIPINGLIWMGSKENMMEQVEQKIGQGFRCIKLKIGAIDFLEEISILSSIRKSYSRNELEIRVDANGAFPAVDALEKLRILADYDLHSIEQPIQAGQWDMMAELCVTSPIKIALDEELISVPRDRRAELLDKINPAYIILKPSLLGGFSESEHWIHLASKRNIGWWITSALESNIGLNAIAQWTFNLDNPMHQGLGTGQLYTNNIVSPLEITNACLVHTDKDWNLNIILG